MSFYLRIYQAIAYENALMCSISSVGSQFPAQAQVIWSLGPMRSIQ